MVTSRKIYPQTVYVNFDIILLGSMPRNKFFVGSIFSGLFLPRNLPTKGLRKVFAVEIYSQYDRKNLDLLEQGPHGISG